MIDSLFLTVETCDEVHDFCIAVMEVKHLPNYAFVARQINSDGKQSSWKTITFGFFNFFVLPSIVFINLRLLS